MDGTRRKQAQHAARQRRRHSAASNRPPAALPTAAPPCATFLCHTVFLLKPFLRPTRDVNGFDVRPEHYQLLTTGIQLVTCSAGPCTVELGWMDLNPLVKHGINHNRPEDLIISGLRLDCLLSWVAQFHLKWAPV